MADYILTNTTVEDLSNIWNYRFEVWSASQTDKYYFILLDDCKELADEKSFLERNRKKSQTIF